MGWLWLLRRGVFRLVGAHTGLDLPIVRSCLFNEHLGAAMTKQSRVVFLLAAVAVGTLLWWVLKSSGSEGMPPPEFKPDRDLASTADSAFDEVSDPASVQEAGVESVTESGIREVALGLISGRVLTGSGKVVPGCEVLVRPTAYLPEHSARVAPDPDGYFAIKVPLGRRYIVAPVSKTHCVWPPRTVNVRPDGDPVAVSMYEMVNVQVKVVTADAGMPVAVPSGFRPTMLINGIEVKEHPSQDLSPELWRRSDRPELDVNCVMVVRVLNTEHSKNLANSGEMVMRYRWPGIQLAESRLPARQALSGSASVTVVAEPEGRRVPVRFSIRYLNGERLPQSFFLECNAYGERSQVYWMREPQASEAYFYLEPGDYEGQVGAMRHLAHACRFKIAQPLMAGVPIDVQIALSQRPDVVVSLVGKGGKSVPFGMARLTPEGDAGVAIESGVFSMGEPFRFVDVWPGVYTVAVLDQAGREVARKNVQVEGVADTVVSMHVQ